MVANSDFVHLHNHTEFSLKDSISRIPDMCTHVKSLGMNSIAMTDHGNIDGVFEFVRECRRAGIEPILGMEAYIAPRQYTKKRTHLTVLARGENGYRSLLDLTQVAAGSSDRKSVPIDTIWQHSAHLVVLSGCPGSEFGQAAQEEDGKDTCTKIAMEFKERFGDRYWLEVMSHGPGDEGLVAKEGNIARMASVVGRNLDIRRVVTNDCHYITPEQSQSQSALFALRPGNGFDLAKSWGSKYSNFGILSSEQMTVEPELIIATRAVAEQCGKAADVLSQRLSIPAIEGTIEEMFLPSTAAYDQVYRDRLSYEMGVIRKLGFEHYFLIVADLCRWAKANGLVIGPGRGSAAGSLVSYALGITSIDPIEHGLIFERFLNPGRNEPPDIDLDFRDSDRPRAIEYLRSKYGANAVSQISTYSTFGDKRLDQDASKLQNALSIDRIKQDLAGLRRDKGKHASGIVVAKEDLRTLPTCKVGESEELLISIEADEVARLGGIKFDILGLKALGIIQDVRTITGFTGDVPSDCPKTYAMLREGRVSGVFQLETSRGMRRLVGDIKVDRFSDLAACIAIFRTGPLAAGFDKRYVYRKHGHEFIESIHPKTAHITKETYGVPIYQEQIMRIAQVLAGYSLERTDNLRKAMGKKLPELMASHRREFVEGCWTASKIPTQQADKIFTMIEGYSGYAFNKSHSVAYAKISYEMAYLKCHYAAAFWAVTLNHAKDVDEVGDYLRDMSREGITPRIAGPRPTCVPVESNVVAVGCNIVKGVDKHYLAEVATDPLVLPKNKRTLVALMHAGFIMGPVTHRDVVLNEPKDQDSVLGANLDVLGAPKQSGKFEIVVRDAVKRSAQKSGRVYYSVRYTSDGNEYNGLYFGTKQPEPGPAIASISWRTDKPFIDSLRKVQNDTDSAPNS